jgi:hypothetical protein
MNKQKEELKKVDYATIYYKKYREEAGKHPMATFNEFVNLMVNQALDQNTKEIVERIQEKLEKEKYTIDQDGDLWGYTERANAIVVNWKDIIDILNSIKEENK